MSIVNYYNATQYIAELKWSHVAIAAYYIVVWEQYSII